MTSAGAGGGGNTGSTGYTITWTGSRAVQPVPGLQAYGYGLTPTAPGAGEPGGGVGGAGGGVVQAAATAHVVRAGQGGNTFTDDQEISVDASQLYTDTGAATSTSGGSGGGATTFNGTVSLFGRVNGTRTTFLQGIVGAASAVLRVVVNGVATVLREVVIPVIGAIGTVVMRVVGAVVTLIRNGVEILRHILEGIFNFVGALFRGVGFGSSHGAGAPPPAVGGVHAHDVTPHSRSGKVTLTNFGTQDGWPRFLCYGPGTFRIQNPGTSNTIEFGPLVAGQIALLTTLPRLRGVIDLSPSAAGAATATQTSFLARLLGLAPNNNTPPLIESFQSLFGVMPPQGPLYSLLKGRFTNPIPPKPAGAPPTPVTLSVTITGGSAASKIVAALTPMRRWPE